MASAVRRSLRAFGFGAAVFTLFLPSAYAQFPNSDYNTSRALVLTVQDPRATDVFKTRPNIIRAMVNRAITNLTGKATVPAAWTSIVSTQGVAGLSREVVGLKVFSLPGATSGTRPAVVAAVVEGLLAAGLPPRHIIVWDRRLVDLRLAGFSDLAAKYGIVLASSEQAGWDENAYYDNPLLGNLVWGDLEFGRKGSGVGRRSYFSKLVSQQITRIISITPLLNQNIAGVSGHLYSLAMGCTDNTIRFESDPDRLASAVPEIYASTNLSDRVVLNITDALICQYEGGERGLLHYSKTLNELRFSRDPVALDYLSVTELVALRQAAGAPTVKPNFDLYTNAALLELGVNDPKRIVVQKVK